MYLKQLRVQGLSGFTLNLPSSGQEDLPRVTRSRLLIQGGNGGGKTTLLTAIGGLWDMFGRMIDHTGSRKFDIPFVDDEFRLIAMRLGDFPVAEENLWIAVGGPNEVAELRSEFPKDRVEAVVRSHVQGRWKISVQLGPEDWRTWKFRSQDGTSLLPNIVQFGPDGRGVMPTVRPAVERFDLFAANWLARYDATVDLDSLMFTAHRSELIHARYEEALERINSLLAPSRKRIAAKPDRDGRMLIEFDRDPAPVPHSWTRLSSGERQMLILLAYSCCLLRPDSILLIDEPDLHIHSGAIRPLMDELRLMTSGRNSQLIVTGHSQRLWDCFPMESERFSTETPWEELADVAS